jgi:hypothetical protein
MFVLDISGKVSGRQACLCWTSPAVKGVVHPELVSAANRCWLELKTHVVHAALPARRELH